MSMSRDGSLIYKHTVVYGLLKLVCDGQNYSHLLQMGLGSFLLENPAKRREPTYEPRLLRLLMKSFYITH